MDKAGKKKEKEKEKKEAEGKKSKERRRWRMLSPRQPRARVQPELPAQSERRPGRRLPAATPPPQAPPSPPHKPCPNGGPGGEGGGAGAGTATVWREWPPLPSAGCRPAAVRRGPVRVAASESQVNPQPLLPDCGGLP